MSKRTNTYKYLKYLSIPCTSSRPEAFLGKIVLKICSKFTGEHPCRSEISIKLQNSLLSILVNTLILSKLSFLVNS